MTSNSPYINIPDSEGACWQGWKDIGYQLLEHIKTLGLQKTVITIESNLGTYLDANLDSIKEVISPNVACKAGDIYKDEKLIRGLIKIDQNTGQYAPNTTVSIEDYFDQQKLEGLRSNIDFIDSGVILIHGIGASKIVEPDILIYSDISRWEKLQRFRRGEISNIGVNNKHLSFSIKEKWNYFVDWRICDKIKKSTIKSCDYFLETNNWKKPKLATGEIIRKGYEIVNKQPFFSAPFFDPLLWEQPTKVSKNKDFGWTFNCNLDKNNILLKLGDYLFETPAINLIYHNPVKFLGEKVYRKFGLELPIRYNFIDSLEENDPNVFLYPGVEYFKENFGIYHQQHENYYVMDCGQKPTVSLGLKEVISKEYMENIASNAGTKKKKKVVQNLLNKLHLKKHDHLIIPEEQLHTKGENVMILSITTSPSIFELNITATENNNVVSKLPEAIFSKDLEISQYQNVIQIKQENGLEVEYLNQLENGEFSIKRIWIDKITEFNTNQTLSVINLIEGISLTVLGDFDEFNVRYAETFIIPASISKYQIDPGNKKIALLISTVNN